MKKEFKVLKLTISKDYTTGIENLLAVLSEIESLENENLPFVIETFNSNGTYFVFASNSENAKYVMDNPQNRKVLDLSKFVENTLDIDDKTHKAYYDIELIRMQNKIMRHDFIEPTISSNSYNSSEPGADRLEA